MNNDQALKAFMDRKAEIDNALALVGRNTGAATMKIKLKPLDTLLAEHTYEQAGRLLGLSKQNLTCRLKSKKPQFIDEMNRIWILSHEPPAEAAAPEETKIQREQRRVEHIFKVARECATYAEFRIERHSQYQQARERGLLPMVKGMFE